MYTCTLPRQPQKTPRLITTKYDQNFTFQNPHIYLDPTYHHFQTITQIFPSNLTQNTATTQMVHLKNQ